MWTIIESPADNSAHLPAFDEPLLLAQNNKTASTTDTSETPGWLHWLKLMGMMTAVLLLAITLAAQLLFYNRDQLLGTPLWRNKIATACQFLACEVPTSQNADALRSVFLDVIPHPNQADAREVRFRIQNTSQVPQGFPAVELLFSNTKNEAVAARRFYPGHYLHPDAFAFLHIRPGAEVDGLLEIADPGADAVNYAIKFVYETNRIP